MEEAILFPSPNWFRVSGFIVSTDNWLVYGGPSKSICVLEPLPSNTGLSGGNSSYKAHVLNRAHSEKIISVDISPEWPAKRSMLMGSADGSVKQWTMELIQNTWRFKSTQSHEVHVHEKEEVCGVGYCNKTIAVSVGCYGNIVKWDLTSNVVRMCNLLKNMKPNCMQCSPHIPLQVAVGTKQGVIFVVDLNEPFKLLYKVRGQDDEITSLSWCPQFEVALKKSLKEMDKKVGKATERMLRIRQIDNESDNIGETEKSQPNHQTERLEVSGVVKNLPEDSFDESAVVQEDDMFDIYKDHEVNEFGHKKFISEDVIVKVKKEEEPLDYLAECEKLRDVILKRKNQPEESIESLVQALDKTHVDNEKSDDGASSSNKEVTVATDVESTHIHRHLLATIGKYGGVRIWSKSGKQVATCFVASSTGKNAKNKSPSWSTILWYKPDILLIADAKSQLLQCNPLKTDCKNKLEWRIVHTLYKRGLYCIASSAPRLQTSELSKEDYPVWTVSQDRNLISYSLATRQTIAVRASCGGYIYGIQQCPYDAGKIAISVGDGAVRVWETKVSEENDSRLEFGHVTSYWQNVQGKVLTAAWHPVRENLLAFSTAESRVGLIDTSGKNEKPARVLLPALNGGVYSLCWGEENNLYACGGGSLVVYNTSKPDEAPAPITVSVEGQQYELSTGRWYPRAMLCGSVGGAVAALSPQRPHTLLAATFIFSKMIHTIEWHPLETSNSTEESPFKNLIAVCSLDKNNSIVILEYCDKEDGSKELQTWKTLTGHKNTVYHVMWNPHLDGQLLSASQDGTVRVWNVAEDVCTNIFGGHTHTALTASWCAYPHLPTKVVSGGTEGCLRIWDINDYPAESYTEIRHEVKRERKRYQKKEPKELDDEESKERVAATLETKIKGPKKFLLPIEARQMSKCNVQAGRMLLNKYLNNNSKSNDVVQSNGCDEAVDTDFIKIFGNINEVNEVLDKELDRHLNTHNLEGWIMLNLFRGHIDTVIQFASKRDLLCPFLLSVAPCVSLKYWKDTTQLYLSQIDRVIAKGEGDKLFDNKIYGGPVYRKAATLLSIHDIKGAVDVLAEAQLFNEAYILCRTRYMDSIADQILVQWAQFCESNGVYNMAAICYLAHGNLLQAATALGRLNKEEWLSLATEIAKVAGQTKFAEHVSEKREQIKNKTGTVDTDETLEQLPTRFELLMKENLQSGNEVSKDEKTANGV
ncbi:gem-associated protein 5-like [Achroia grisella]|uniref:gem-associated protein 5-like n=1 Tax=Achroia grisella TaxID=688607 RepID=UPI0027D2005A|nr:gem-associated protein 5-like [Achroia grisella]